MATDAEKLDSFSVKITTIKEDLTYLKHVIPSTDINSIAKINNDLDLLNDMNAEVENLKTIETRYRNATDIWIL